MRDHDVNPMRDRDRDRFRPPARAHPSHAEGTLTRLIEQQAAKIPSSYFLVAAFGAMVGSVLFEATGRRRQSRFIGMWAPTLLIAGVYNKLVKTFGTT